MDHLEGRGLREPEGLPYGTIERLAGMIEGVAAGGGFVPRDLRLAADILRGLAPKEEAPQPLGRPLTIEDMRSAPGGIVRGVVAMGLTDVIDHNYDSFLDALSRLLVGSELLSDVHYRLVGTHGGEILVEVSGDVAQILVDEEDALSQAMAGDVAEGGLEECMHSAAFQQEDGSWYCPYCESVVESESD